MYSEKQNKIYVIIQNELIIVGIAKSVIKYKFQKNQLRNKSWLFVL